MSVFRGRGMTQMGPAERKAQHGQSRGGDQGPGAGCWELQGPSVQGTAAVWFRGADRRQESDGGTAGRERDSGTRRCRRQRARQNKGKTVTEPWDFAMRWAKRLPDALVAAYGVCNGGNGSGGLVCACHEKKCGEPACQLRC